ncbi:MAG: hypothetical protein IJU56_03710 [Clostridia bacterium]|nr:hypothetical protein [Clostridia bacterium]
MSAQGFDLGALGDVLSSLRPEDIAALQGMAQSMFSASSPAGAQSKPQSAAPDSGSSGLFGGLGSLGGMDFETLARIASLFDLLKADSNDPRAKLLQSLRPLLSEERRPRVDQAVQMLRLFSMLDKLK